MRVIGTAGHVDHGKSTLIAALTGTHPDRLREEQEREMTIDLGFAWMALPDGEQVGIVDVPGHRDFIENMLAGVGGIDAVLFVVAADEGVMPQTREHLAILDLLQINAGIVVLTKTDMIDDPEWLDLVEADVRDALEGTVLDGAPLVRVSSKTGEGLEQLLHELQTCLAEQPPRADLGRPRLPVDRVFTIAGFGTVVTGTLIDGRLRLGEEVEILPAGLRGRIRGLQSHKRKEQSAPPGSRTAVNITGLEVDQIQRGSVVAYPDKYRPTQRVDVYFRLLPDAAGPIRHSAEVKFFLGTAEILARVRLLGVEELKPGEEGWLQLELRERTVAVRGDRYILRRPSPAETLGGGTVLDPHPKGRHRRFDEDVLARLESLRRGSPAEVLQHAFQSPTAISIRDAVARSRLSEDQARAGLQELLDSGKLVLLEPASKLPAAGDGGRRQTEAAEPAAGPDSGSRLAEANESLPVANESLPVANESLPFADLLAWDSTRWQEESARAGRELDNYHRAYPLRRGMPREEFKSRLKIASPRLFNAALRRWTAEGLVEEAAGGSQVWRPGHAIRLTPQQRAQADRLLTKFTQSPFAPPSIKEAQAEVGEDVYQALVDLGELTPVSAEVVFRKQDYEQMVSIVREHFEHEPLLTAAQLRDRLNTSRRYVLALLEHLDAAGITVREGDARKLRQLPYNR